MKRMIGLLLALSLAGCATGGDNIKTAAVVDPNDYVELVADLEAGGGQLSLARRFALAQKAFAHAAAYDAAISRFLDAQDPAKVPAAYTI